MNLIFHHGTLGDFVLTLPLLSAMEGPTTLVTPWSRGRLAVRLMPELRMMELEMFEFTRLHSESGPSTLSPAIAELFDQARWIVSWIGDPQGRWAANVARLAPQATVVKIPTQPREDEVFTGHVADYYLERLANHGLRLKPSSGEVRSNPDGPILVHPGSGGTVKCWPMDRFEKLIARLRGQGHEVLPVLGETELHHWPKVDVARWVQGLDAQTPQDPEALLQLAMNARAYIGNDAGPTHLAAMAGLPTLALFGPSDSVRWSPRGPAVEVLATPNRLPITELTAEDVERAVESLLGG